MTVYFRCSCSSHWRTNDFYHIIYSTVYIIILVASCNKWFASLWQLSVCLPGLFARVDWWQQNCLPLISYISIARLALELTIEKLLAIYDECTSMNSSHKQSKKIIHLNETRINECWFKYIYIYMWSISKPCLIAWFIFDEFLPCFECMRKYIFQCQLICNLCIWRKLRPLKNKVWYFENYNSILLKI